MVTLRGGDREIDMHTFDDALASHLNDGAGAAVPKATVPRFDVGHRTRNMGRRRRSFKRRRRRRRRNGREIVKITAGQDISAGDSGAREVRDPARGGVKVAGKVPREVQRVDGHQADVTGGDIKNIVQGQSVTRSHGNINRATANSRDRRATKASDTLRGNRSKRFEVRASGGDMTGGPAVKDKRKTRRKIVAERGSVGRGQMLLPIKVTMHRTGGKRGQEGRGETCVPENKSFGILEIRGIHKRGIDSGGYMCKVGPMWEIDRLWGRVRRRDRGVCGLTWLPRRIRLVAIRGVCTCIKMIGAIGKVVMGRRVVHPGIARGGTICEGVITRAIRQRVMLP